MPFCFCFIPHVDREQLQYHFLGIRHANPDGSTLFRPSEQYGAGAAVSLRTTGANDNANKAGFDLMPPQGMHDLTAPGYDRLNSRELLDDVVCEAVVAVDPVVAAVGAVVDVSLTVIIGFSQYTIRTSMTIDDTGVGKATFSARPSYLNDDRTDFCDGCPVNVSVGNCLMNCDGFDRAATNTGLPFELLQVWSPTRQWFCSFSVYI